MTYILRSTDPDAKRVERAGGKAASLARLVEFGFPVPDFFVVSVAAFEEVADGEDSDIFRKELRDAYEELGGDGTALAVRSSATGEDSRERSFAGLYHTSLGVFGFDDVVEAVKRCWSSYGDEHAAFYRSQEGEESRGGMAVVVQRLVEGQWSGVSFTADPVTSSLSDVVISAARGLGEKLVSGAVNPAEVVVRRDDGTIVRSSDGDEGPVSRHVLDAVWKRSVDIADALGFPQDIEWTLRDEEFVLLQSRPITTIAGIFYNRYIEPWRDDASVAEDPDVVWTRAYGDEVWTSPETPLNYSVRNPPGRSAGWFGSYLPMHGDTDPLPAACAKYYKAAAYANVDVLKRVYKYHPPVARISGILNFFPKDLRDEVKSMAWPRLARLRRHWRLEMKNDKHINSIRRNHTYLESLWAPFVEKSDGWIDKDLDALSLDELRAHMMEVLPEMGNIGLPCAVGVMWHSFDLTFLLTGLLDRWFGGGDVLYAQVSAGLDNSETVAEAEAIWRLAKIAREAGPAVARVVQESDWEASRSRTGEPGLERFVSELSAFLRDHRHRGASYKDVGYPRWGDNPDLLLNMVKTYLESDADSPAELNRVQGEARKAKQRELLGRVRLRPIRRAVLKWLLGYNEIYMGIRNDHRFYFDRIWYELRRIYRSMGRRLADQGVITDGDDVFFLGATEVEAGLAGQLPRDEAQRRVFVRKVEWEQTLMSQAPKFLKGYVPFSDEVAAGEGDAVSGVAASPGVATARARVIYRLEELPGVRDGEILVTRQTDPGWTPVFAKIKGLVLETGSVLAHGTSLCREYGLPCVTAVEGATRRIPDGAEIRIDGSTGQVVLLSGPSVEATVS